MFWAVILFLSLYFLLLFCLTYPNKKNINVRFSIAILWSITYGLWFLHNPMYRGPVSIIKSVNRNSINGNTVRNWGDTDYCKPKNILIVNSVEEIKKNINNKNIRIVGGGHSWSPLICSNETVIKLNYCQMTYSKNILSADAGCTIEDVNYYLYQYNRTLYGFGGIQYQTLGGSMMTSLHGAQFNAFVDHIVKIQAILANSSIIEVTNDLKFWKSSMGMLGIVLKMDINTYPLIHVKKENQLIKLSDALEFLNDKSLEGLTIDAVLSSNEAYAEVSTYKKINHEKKMYKNSSDVSYTFAFFYDNIALPTMLLASSVVKSVDVTTINFKKINDVYSLLDAWKIHPGQGYISAEYSVPLLYCPNAIKQIQNIAKPYIVALYIRKLYASNHILAFSKIDSCIIDTSFLDYQYLDVENKINKYHLEVEKIIFKYNGSVHWGKYFISDSSFIIIPDEFKEYRKKIDPTDKFLNNFTRDLIYQEKKKRYKRFAISERGLIWRVSWWITISFFLINFCYKSKNKTYKYMEIDTTDDS
jgi:FAD/FMN-containing dehydrogenase